MIYPIKSTANRIPITDTGTLKRFVDSPIQKTATINVQIDAGSTEKVPFTIQAGNLKTPTLERGAIEYKHCYYITNEGRIRIGIPGIIFEDYSDVPNVDADPTDLYVFTTPSELLSYDGEQVKIDCSGTLSNTIATKQIQIYFGSDLLFQTNDIIVGDTTGFVVLGKIIRVAEDKIKYYFTLTANYTNNPNPFVSTVSGSLICTPAAANEIKIKGMGAVTGDVIGEFCSMKWIPQPNL